MSKQKVHISVIWEFEFPLFGHIKIPNKLPHGHTLGSRNLVSWEWLLTWIKDISWSWGFRHIFSHWWSWSYSTVFCLPRRNGSFQGVLKWHAMLLVTAMLYFLGSTQWPTVLHHQKMTKQYDTTYHIWLTKFLCYAAGSTDQYALWSLGYTVFIKWSCIF